MFWFVDETYFARRDSCKTYLGNHWLSESNGLQETYFFKKLVKGLCNIVLNLLINY